MKKKEGFVMNSVCGEKILIAEGIENIDINHIVALNSTAAFLWENMGDDVFTVDDLVERLTAQYDVSADVAKSSIEQFLEDMKKAGAIED